MLKKGKSKKTMAKNMAKMMDEGYPAKQAAAIMYDVAGKTGKKASKKKVK